MHPTNQFSPTFLAVAPSQNLLSIEGLILFASLHLLFYLPNVSHIHSEELKLDAFFVVSSKFLIIEEAWFLSLIP